MKKITVLVCLVILIIAILAIASILLLTRDFGTDQGIRLEMEDNTLIVSGYLEIASKWVAIARYPGVPKGVKKEVAYKATEEGEADFVASKGKATKFKFSFPVKKINILEMKRVVWQNGKWGLEKLKPIAEEENDWIGTVASITFPLLGIFMATFLSQRDKIENKRLFIFYFFLIGVMVITALLGHFLGIYVGLLFGTFLIGGLGGACIGNYVAKYGDIGNTLIVSGFTGVWVGMTTVIFRNETYLYIIFITLICAFSYFLCYFLLRFFPQFYAKEKKEEAC